MFDISPIQIIIVLVIALVIFGPKRLPEMGRNIGRGLRDFRDGLSGDAPEPPPAAAAPDPEPSPLEMVEDASEPPPNADPALAAASGEPISPPPPPQ